jgi:hypothetical protein
MLCIHVGNSARCADGQKANLAFGPALKELRIVGYVFNPKLIHESAYVIRPEAPIIGVTAAKVTYSYNSRV